MADDVTRLKALIAALRQIRKHAKRYWTEYASADQQRTHNAWLTKFPKETGEDLSHFRINVHSYYDRYDFISTLDATISYLEILVPSWQSRQKAARNIPTRSRAEPRAANDESVEAEFLEI